MTKSRRQAGDKHLEKGSELTMLHEENARLQEVNREVFVYLRDKIDDLLSVIGTQTLKPEELDDHNLIEFDPIGIVTKAFQHVLDNVRETNHKLSFAHNEIQTIFDTVGAAIMVLNPQGKVVAHNQRTKDLLLGQDLDITGKSCREQICTYGNSDRRCTFQNVLEKGREQHIPNWSLNGRSFDVVGRPMFDESGVISNVVISYTDVSARRNAETSLMKALTDTQEANAKLNAILRSVADSVLVTDADEQIIMLNGRAEELFGFCLSDKAKLPGINTLPCKELVDFLRKASSQNEDQQVRDFVLFEADGQEHIYQARLTVINTSEAGFNGCLTILHDVTEERKVERMKSDFVSTAAHELRTPLATIIGYADLLLMKKDSSPKEQREYLELIQNKADRLGDIVGDLLDISRIESGEGLQLTPQPCRIDWLCEEVLRSFVHQESAHEFVVDVPSSMLIHADRFAVLQILENILSNAVKYSPQGGIIKISAVSKGGLCCCTIADHGLGMTSAQLEKIYEKFYRVDATNTAISGTGLGMTIVKHLIEALGGDVHIASVPGKGTTVSLSFPCCTE